MSKDGLAPLAIDVVSVQSQVVYGRVGNNVALPVFERNGWRTASVPTVVLSNTPHYPSIHGGPMPDDWFAGWLDDLEARGALSGLRAVQAGYLGSPGQARILRHWITRQREHHPALQVCIDPVIGDADVGVYVDARLVDGYRDGLLTLADGITPNAFELGRLAEHGVDTLDDIAAAARALIRGSLRWVLATSALPQQWPANRMQMALITADSVEVIEHERIEATPKGTGDLFSAELSSRLLRGTALAQAAREAGDAVVHALRRTRDAGSEELLP